MQRESISSDVEFSALRLLRSMGSSDVFYC